MLIKPEVGQSQIPKNLLCLANVDSFSVGRKLELSDQKCNSGENMCKKSLSILAFILSC